MNAFTPLDPPGRDAVDYLRKFDIAALVVFCPAPAAPCQPVATIDVSEALKRTQKTWPTELEPPLLAQAWWVSGIRPAQQVLNLGVACDLRSVSFAHNRLAAPLEIVEAALVAAAARLKITLTDYQTGLDRVGSATATLGGQLDSAQADGVLKPFNIEFQRRRQLAHQNGRRFMSYRQARLRLVALLGHAAARGEIGPKLLRQVFED